MPFDPPRSLSPSKITAFRDCALAFRFSAIDHLPDPPTPWTVKGTLVHSALERLFWNHEQGTRSIDAAQEELELAWAQLRTEEGYQSLGLDATEAKAFVIDAATLVDNYFRIEDPNAVRTVGVELMVEAHMDGVRVRGIIDRLDVTDDGDLIIVDYKTGRAPAAAYEAAKMGGVHVYALLCQELLGRRPVQVRLLHLREPIVIAAAPTDQALRGHRRKTIAVWSAIERACATEDFRPRTSPLCRFCAFRAYCPAQGGDPELAPLHVAGPAVGSRGQADGTDMASPTGGRQ